MANKKRNGSVYNLIEAQQKTIDEQKEQIKTLKEREVNGRVLSRSFHAHKVFDKLDQSLDKAIQTLSQRR